MRVNNASGAVNGLNGEPILTLKHVEAQMGSSVFQALLLTMMGAAGTALGGLLVIAQPTMNFRKLGALQGLAAGLMLSISLMDLLPEAAEEIGFIAANVCFYVGVLFFAAVVTLIPDPDSFITDQVAFGSKAAAVGRREQGMKVVEVKAVAIGHAARGRPALTRACSPAPGLEHAAVDAAPPARAAELSSNRPSAAACLHQSFPDGQGGSDRLQQHNCSYAAKGLAGVADGDSSLANGNADSKDTSRKLKRQLLLSGLITAVGIALHNFPEGVAVFLAAQKSPAIGGCTACYSLLCWSDHNSQLRAVDNTLHCSVNALSRDTGIHALLH
eukprot:GHRR01018857.1.p1 GENE.GHRR01018857.1~~GHRR01018857.1.p1  ORF type:complete len:329 (+),score=111.59 GHRR01018857.1:960-1946(+)